MCTVTFIARRNGYAIGMNRDENLSRVQGLPPAQHQVNGRAAVFPSEPSGGTWIGVNDARVTFALINWYTVPTRVSDQPVSRGQVTLSVLGFDDPEAAEDELLRYPLVQTNPFRLIGIFPESHSVVEWRWDLRCLQRVAHDWQTNIWVSSGYDEPGADIARRKTFQTAIRAGVAQDLRWLRQLHSSHDPAPNPYSICMHRADARTVSYSEVSATDSAVEMTYSPSPLCRCHSKP